MIANYLKTTLRHLWRHRLFTALNILGLAIGISACWIIYRIVDYEFSYDKQHPDAEQVYQLVAQLQQSDESFPIAAIARAIAPAIKNDVTGAELVVPSYKRSADKVSALNQHNEEITSVENVQKAIETLPAYFDLVPYQWLAGAKETALTNPNQVVLTESRARQYFPKLDPSEVLGSTLRYNDTLLVKVSGVVADLPYLSSFEEQEFFLLSDKEWNSDVWGGFNSDDNLYLKMLPNSSKETFLAQINLISDKNNKELFDSYDIKVTYNLLPLAEKHFVTDYASHSRVANKKVMYGLMGIAGFILLLACINYINLSTAQLPQRAREIGIRKTLGSAPRELIFRFLGETFVITILAGVLSAGITMLVLNAYKEFIPSGLENFQNHGGLIAFLLVLALAITGLSGIYPAWLITRVQTVKVLKGQTETTVGKARFNLRKGLIAFQFIIAQVFIISAVIIGQQLQYTLQKDLGFDKEAVIAIDIPFKIRNDSTYRDKHFVFKQELVGNPGITAVALGDRPLSNAVRSSLFFIPSDTGRRQQSVYLKYADEDLLDLYNFELIAGSKLSASDTTREYIVNETLVKAYGFPTAEAIIGVHLDDDRGNILPITGVVRDFHNLSFKSEIKPVAFLANKKSLSTVNIKLARTDERNWSKTISEIEAKWKTLYPSVPFKYKFYDESIAALYQSEQSTSKLIGLATGITIFISCLGLFGLATLTAFQRTKEIGIRKVLGATVMGIIALLSKDFVKIVCLAIVIASPIAWWAMNKWLEDFNYRVEIQWWMFAVAGLAAVVIALLTVATQAIRAAVANPVDSLRDE